MFYRLYPLAPTVLLKKSFIYFQRYFLLHYSFLIIDHISVAAGDRDQRGSAPGDGAPWFANHSRDLHRARDAVQTRGSGGEVGSPGSGSENDSLHNTIFVSHPKQTHTKKKQKASGEETKGASLEKTFPRRISASL